jgi:hypothetical protein
MSFSNTVGEHKLWRNQHPFESHQYPWCVLLSAPSNPIRTRHLKPAKKDCTHPDLDAPPLNVHTDLQTRDFTERSKDISPFLLQRRHAVLGYWYTRCFGSQKRFLSTSRGRGGRGGVGWGRWISIDHEFVVVGIRVGFEPGERVIASRRNLQGGLQFR